MRLFGRHSICLRMIVRDADEKILENVLNSYKDVIDYYVILDTGSTNETIKTIKKTMRGVRGEIHESSFKGFSESRNECLTINGNVCEWNFMIDDSYVFVGRLRDEIKTIKKNKNLIGIRIRSHDGNVYYSKRISRASAKLRYEGKIHEDIIKDCDYVLDECYISDVTSDYHKERSFNRFYSDLEILSNDVTPRGVYYRGYTNYVLFCKTKDDKYKNDCIRDCLQRIEMQDEGYEEKFLAMQRLGHMAVIEKNNPLALEFYKKAILMYPDRRGECFFYMYLITGLFLYIKMAYNSPLGMHSLVVKYDIYEKYIPELYFKCIVDSQGNVS
jgi:hypothetical protein